MIGDQQTDAGATVEEARQGQPVDVRARRAVRVQERRLVDQLRGQGLQRALQVQAELLAAPLGQAQIGHLVLDAARLGGGAER